MAGPSHPPEHIPVGAARLRASGPSAAWCGPVTAPRVGDLRSVGVGETIPELGGTPEDQDAIAGLTVVALVVALVLLAARCGAGPLGPDDGDDAPTTTTVSTSLTVPAPTTTIPAPDGTDPPPPTTAPEVEAPQPDTEGDETSPGGDPRALRTPGTSPP